MTIHPKTLPARARAMMLIECIVYMAIFVILLGVAGAAFFDCWNASDAFCRNADDIARSLRAGEQWRADIRAAAGPVETAARNGIRSLRIPTRTGAILYTFANSEIRRNAPPAGDVPLLSRVKSSQMQSESSAGVTVWRWELELLAGKKNPQLRPLFNFAAVPVEGTSP